MSIELEDRGQALENEYFHRQEKELLEKMKAKLEAEKNQEVVENISNTSPETVNSSKEQSETDQK